MTEGSLRATEIQTLRLAGLDVNVFWRRSARARRVSVRVDMRSGAVVVTLPPRTARQAGVTLLREHAAWLTQRIEALPLAISFAPGAMVPVGGIAHPVEHVRSGRGGAWIEDGRIMVSGEPEFLGRRVADFLRAEARRRLAALVSAIARDGLSPRRITIKDTRTRWGSCTATGTVMFNWRLVMAPPEVQHYVVAHELAHLAHMDHGPAFWHLVRSLTPHEVFAESWLRRQGAGLLRVG